MFSQCKSLSILPDISKWDTSQVSDMSYAFYKCYSISFLPDISNWNINKVTNINHFFSDCYSLSYLPDISKGKFSNEISISFIFNNCISILLLPENNFDINIRSIYQNPTTHLEYSENINNKNIVPFEKNIKI